MTRLPSRLLIANRGEIACRIIRTARRLGIETVAVYSAADRHALHVREAHRAEYLGPANARDSYLNINALLQAAHRSHADAVHPGYGFLSENASFAESCLAAGLCFIGPPPAAIRTMGSKSAAKELLEATGIPLLPGYHGDAQSVDELSRQAERIGYPLLIKASAGGGGKGIRRVDDAADFRAALAACQREAEASFGDPQVLLERYVLRPRHIELQIFADVHGNAIHLGERDCSVQRRHQKVLEEAPAPGMSETRRNAMGLAAVNAAQRVGYVGAGTVEFIVDTDDAFYFMEMNTRLQVEHPVTEMITGIDLVEWQLRVAAGEPLPLTQEQVRLQGHAIELRLYAEDPARGFLPSPGRIDHWQPPSGDGIRIDTGVESGDVISEHYDAMIAKLIAHGEDRAQALARLARALETNFLVGPRNNLDFLARLIDTRAVREADLDTALIEREHKSLFVTPGALPTTIWLAAIAVRLLHECAHPRVHGESSPWGVLDGFRLAGQYRRSATLEAEGERRTTAIEYRAAGWQVTLEESHALQAEQNAVNEVMVSIDGALLKVQYFMAADLIHLRVEGRQTVVRWVDPCEQSATQDEPDAGLRSPMPGRVVAVHVKVGQRVKRGAALLALEAMKMEHVITAPADGIVQQINVAEGAQVAEAVPLVEFMAD